MAPLKTKTLIRSSVCKKNVALSAAPNLKKRERKKESERKRELMCLCVCACVCVCERERQRETETEKGVKRGKNNFSISRKTG